MPVVPSHFQPPWLLRNGHVQTILGAFLRRRTDVHFEAERLELDDGDFLDLGWLRRGRDQVAILSHGLEGSLSQNYMSGMAAALATAGWDSLAWSFRGCGRETNRLLRFYHSGETGDLGFVIQHAAAQYSRIALIGFSLGGNLTLKYLGEATPHPNVIGAAAISAPIDLAASARKLDQRRINRLYLRRFIKTLVAKIETKAVRFPNDLEIERARRPRNFQEFDDRYTAPIHGFRDAADYWAQSSALQFLHRIAVPTLLLNARNDPFLAPECFPLAEAGSNPCLFFEAPNSGGHLGFVDRLRNFQPAHEARVVEFLAGCVTEHRAGAAAT
jgi:predicted alpha/beta-fold hydrolase